MSLTPPMPTPPTGPSAAAVVATVTAAHLVESVAQPDDSGAATADRYEWQAAMAAADGLALYLDCLGVDGQLRPDCQDRVLCEWHEDWVLFRESSVELVSCKHRDPEAGAYTTIVKLADDGGLAHLHDRWAALQEKPWCRLVTSGGLGNGPPQELLAAAQRLRSLQSAARPVIVDPDHADILTQLRRAMATYCGATKKRWEGSDQSDATPDAERDAEVARFLASLTISEKHVQRDHVSYAAPAMYAQPVLDRLSYTGSAAAVWEAVLSLFRARMRSRGPLPTGGLPVVLPGEPQPAVHDDWYALGTPLEMQRELASRTVTLLDIHTAIAAALAVPGGYEPIPRMLRSSRLEVKMDAGGCSDNAIERAVSLCSDYQEYWRDREQMDAAARAERRRLERLLHRISDQTTDDQTMNAAEPRGALFWRRLQTALDALPSGGLPADMDADLALGGVCDLAGRCKVWFGPRFDIDIVLARVRADVRAQP